MQIYEITYLILSSIPEDKVSGVAESIKEIISKEGGTEIDGETPFKQPLAYTMSKTVGASRYVSQDAYLGWIKFEVDPSACTAIKSSLEKLPEVLRFLLVKAPRKTYFSFAKARAAQKALEENLEGDIKVPEEDKLGKVLEQGAK